MLLPLLVLMAAFVDRDKLLALVPNPPLQGFLAVGLWAKLGPNSLSWKTYLRIRPIEMILGVGGYFSFGMNHGLYLGNDSPF